MIKFLLKSYMQNQYQANYLCGYLLFIPPSLISDSFFNNEPQILNEFVTNTLQLITMFSTGWRWHKEWMWYVHGQSWRQPLVEYRARLPGWRSVLLVAKG